MKPVRIQRSRQHKQVSPNGFPIVYVGRPGKWGNPYKIGSYSPWLGRTCSNIDDVIKSYRLRVQASEAMIRLIKYHLKDKNLSCWCRLDEECHADVLLEIANE